MSESIISSYFNWLICVECDGNVDDFLKWWNDGEKRGTEGRRKEKV